jgi:hypothetical protein
MLAHMDAPWFLQGWCVSSEIQATEEKKNYSEGRKRAFQTLSG